MKVKTSLFANRSHALSELAALIAVLALAIFLRFYALGDRPGWYSDEGSFIDVASQLTQGHWGYFALRGSPLLIGRQPLFFIVLAAVFRISGSSLLALRTLIAVESVLTILLLFVVGRMISGAALGLLAAGFLTIYPWAAAYQRMGFTYNQLALFMLISFACAWQFSRTSRSLLGWVAAVSGGLALATDYLGIVSVALLLLIFWVYNRRWLFWGGLWIILAIIPVIVPVAGADPSGFWADLRFTFGRVSVPLAQQLVNSLFYYADLVRQESWFVVGLLGLGLLSDRRARSMALLICGLTLLIVVRNLLPVGRNYHHLIQLYPFISLGVAALLLRILPELADLLRTVLERIAAPALAVFPRLLRQNAWPLVRTMGVAGGVVFLVMGPLVVMLFSSLSGPAFGFFPVFSLGDSHDLANPTDVKAVMNYLQEHAGPQSVILASPQIAWGLPGHPADFAQALAYDGQDAQVLPSLPHERFAFPCGLAEADYVVVDPLARGYATRLIPALGDLLTQVKKWPLVYFQGDIQIYRNPSR